MHSLLHHSPLLLSCISLIMVANTKAKDSALELQKNERIVFFGDSITKGGVRPHGYITLLDTAIQKAYPEHNIKLIGAGIGGNKVTDLQKRLKTDVLQHNPTLVFIYIGINDVWHWTHPKAPAKGLKGSTPEEYRKGLESLISQINETGARVLLCSPAVIGEKHDGSNPDDQILDQYVEIMREVAKRTSTPLIDLRRSFMEYLHQHNPDNLGKGILTKDTVHLNEKGNRFVANQILKVLAPEATL